MTCHPAPLRGCSVLVLVMVGWARVVNGTELAQARLSSLVRGGSNLKNALSMGLGRDVGGGEKEN